LGLPGYVPNEAPPKVETEWLMQYVTLDEEVRQKRYEDTMNAQSERLSLEQKRAIEKANAIAKAVEDYAEDREKAEEALKAALAAGDGEALGVAVATGRDVIAKLEGAPASVTSGLARLLKVGQPRLEQYLERESKRKTRNDWLEKMKRGDAADWHMSGLEFWQHAEMGNIAAVRAGLLAKQPVLNRSSDGRRLTVLHIACKRACTEALKAASQEPPPAAQDADDEEPDARVRAKIRASTSASNADTKTPDIVQGGPEAGAGLGIAARAEVKDPARDEGKEPNIEAPQTLSKDLASKSTKEKVDPRLELANKRVAVVEALLGARAIPNTLDSSGRTPLDLAIFEGGPGSENLPIVKRLRELGLLTTREAGDLARREAEAKKSEPASPKTPKKATTQKPAGRRGFG
jgi:hypothetical protein